MSRVVPLFAPSSLSRRCLQVTSVAKARVLAVVGQGFSNEQRARWSFRYESEANPTDQKAVFGA